ncbi:MAG: hypothetical protein ACM3VT_15075 [Solirubrobacterales bacterium]
MNSRGRIRCVMVCVLLLVGSAAWAGEPNETPIHLEFEISPTPLPASSAPIVRSGNAWKDFNAIEPGYAADIAIVGPTAFIPFPNRRSSSDKDDFIAAAMHRADLSEGQQALLGILHEVYKAQPEPLRKRIDPNHPEHFLLYAVTLEDARKMAEIYGQFAADRFRRSLDWQQSRIRDLANELAGNQKKLSELGQSEETTAKQLQELRKLVPYRNTQQATDAVAELDKTLNPARVEIAGLQAKLKAIQEHMKTISPDNAELRSKLETMFVEESISLQVAEARYRTAQELRKQANDYTDFTQAQTRIVQEKLQIEKDLPNLSKGLQEAKDSLQATMREEPQIPTKVVIHRIEWANGGQGN